MMDPNEITLESIDLMFQYESQARQIDELPCESAQTIAKCYLKLYLQQQEIFKQLVGSGLTDPEDDANIV